MRPLSHITIPTKIVTPWGARFDVLRDCPDMLFPLGVTPGQTRILLYIQQHSHYYSLQCPWALGLTSRSVGYLIQMVEQKRWVNK